MKKEFTIAIKVLDDEIDVCLQSMCEPPIDNNFNYEEYGFQNTCDLMKALMTARDYLRDLREEL